MIGFYMRWVLRVMWNFLRVLRKSFLFVIMFWCLVSGVGYNWLGVMECDSNFGGVIVGESIVLMGVEFGVIGVFVCISGCGGNGEVLLWFMVSICFFNGEEIDGVVIIFIFEIYFKKFYFFFLLCIVNVKFFL